MKKLYAIALTAICCLGLSGCSDNDPDDPNTPDTPQKPASYAPRAYVLSQGAMYMSIEGSLNYINLDDNTAVSGAFVKANNRSIGNTPQNGITYGAKTYLAIYESNLIEVIDRTTCKSIKQISLASETAQYPRSLVAKDGKIYASMYNGYVCRLDTASLTIDATVAVGPNPEMMAIRGDYLYVPNSDGLNYEVGYGTTASKISLKDFKVVSTFQVGLNPTKFVSDSKNLFLLCMGNYTDIPATVYSIDNADKSIPIAEATLVDIYNGKLYYINAPFYLNVFDYKIYDIAKGTTTDMLADGGVDSPAALGVDPSTGSIFISSNSMENGYPSYIIDGYVVRYDASGHRIKKFDAGVSPTCIFF